MYLFVSLLYSRISRIRKRKKILVFFLLMNDTYDFNSCVALHVRIANLLVMDSCCRGGIVNIRGGCSRVPRIRSERPKALWRFRASTSNSRSDRSRLQTYTHLRYICHTYAQQDIRVYEDDQLKPRNWQYHKPKALSLLRVSI